MLPLLHSISGISRVIDTDGSMPVVVLANDLEDYACKYDSKNKLINEFLAPTFGLRYNNDAIDATNVLLGLKNDHYELGKFTNRLDLLKIALFDLWLANDDRNHNNYNLLLVDNRFIPIDHSNIFDGCRLGSELAQLTEDDSILTSDLALTFLNQKAKVEEEATRLIQNFPTFVNNCNEILPTIIENIPDEWCNDKPSLLGNITSSIINNNDWLSETISSFSQLIHKFIR